MTAKDRPFGRIVSWSAKLVALALLHFASVGSGAELFSMELYDFYGWNLPFAREFSAQIPIASVGYIDYKLGVDMSAYFTIVFTPMIFETDATVLYSFTELNPIQLNGKWLDVDFVVTGKSGAGVDTNYTMTLKCFVASGITAMQGV